MNEQRTAGMAIGAYKQTLTSMLEDGTLALPSNVSAAAFKSAAVVAFTDNQQVANCSPTSIFRSVRRLAAMGLVPDGIEAALVPFGRECQAMPMVAGLIKRARNSGEVKALWADVVYEGETVEIWIDDGERRWSHCLESGNRIKAMDRGGKVIGAYAVSKLTDGTVDFEPMSLQQIEKVRAVSKAKNGPAWSNWFDEMAKKTAIRRLSKRLPLSAEDRRSIIESDADTLGPMRDVTPQRPALAEPVADEIIEPEPEPDAPPAEKAKAARTGKAKAKPAEAAEVINDDDAEEIPFPEVCARIMSDLADAQDTGTVEGTAEMFGEQIEHIRAMSPKAGEALDDAIEAARERVAG